MPIKRKERENSNETACVKSYRMDHIPTEHELFLQAFESKSRVLHSHTHSQCGMISIHFAKHTG